MIDLAENASGNLSSKLETIPGWVCYQTDLKQGEGRNIPKTAKMVDKAEAAG